jgi:partner of Y14 and mago
LDAEEAAAGENDMRDSLDSVTKQISSIAISESPVTATPSTNVVGNSQPESSAPDPDKKIRALKKKVILSFSLNMSAHLLLKN